MVLVRPKDPKIKKRKELSKTKPITIQGRKERDPQSVFKPEAYL